MKRFLSAFVSFFFLAVPVFALSTNGIQGTVNGKLVLNPAYFHVDKNGTDQTGIADATLTAVTWSREVYDNGGYFASNVWTPPAGTYVLHAKIQNPGTNLALNGLNALYFFKNGGGLANYTLYELLAAALLDLSLEILVEANGTDAFSVYVYYDTSASTATISGDALATYFEGWQIK